MSHCLRFVRCQRDELCACSQRLHRAACSLCLWWIALLAMLWPISAKCFVLRASLCRLKLSARGRIEGVARVGLCLHAGSKRHRSPCESVGLSRLGHLRCSRTVPTCQCSQPAAEFGCLRRVLRQVGHISWKNWTFSVEHKQ